MNKIIRKHFTRNETQPDPVDRRLDYKDTIFINCTFGNVHDSRFDNCEFINCRFSWSNLKYSNIINCKFENTNFEGADLRDVNFSGSKGLLDPYKFLLENFEFTKDGIVVYKTFNSYYIPNPNWKIEENSIIEEEVNFNRVDDCGCGINVATIKYIKENIYGYQNNIWKLIIPPDGIFTICVPYDTLGQFRCGKAKLLEIVG